MHRYYEDNAIELYNLDKDITERINLAEKEPEMVQELIQAMDNWIVQIGAPIPIKKNLTYDSRFEKVKIDKYLEKNSKK